MTRGDLLLGDDKDLTPSQARAGANDCMFMALSGRKRQCGGFVRDYHRTRSWSMFDVRLMNNDGTLSDNY